MYKTILVAIDGSESAKHALECAATSAEKWKANLVVLSVVPSPPTVFTDVGGFTPDYSLDYEKNFTAYHIGVLEDAKKYVKEKHPKLSVSTQIKKGHVATRIIEASEESEADLLVIGCKGHGGLTGWFLGSVTNYVANHCKTPVLVVK